MDNPELITALATVAIAAVTAAVGGVTCYLIWRGIREMGRSSNQRAEDRREVREADLRRHTEVMDEGRRRHKEVMDEGRRQLTIVMEEGLHRHNQVMEDGRLRHEETMTALQELIVRTSASRDTASPT